MNTILRLFVLLHLAFAFAFAAIAQPLLKPQSGLQKIEQALSRQEISEADAAGFRVLNFFNSSALPQQFHSDPGASEAGNTDLALGEARQFLPEMSESLAVLVYSYMIPPPFHAQNINKDNDSFPTPGPIPNRLWTYTDSDLANVRVWYRRDNFAEERLAGLILATLSNEIIPAEEALMGRRHQSDNKEEYSLLVRAGILRPWPNGGDGKFDVYLFDFPAPPPGKQMPHAWTQGYPSTVNPNIGCPGGPTYMAINLLWASTADVNELSSILAHEFFHVLQSTYDMKSQCRFYRNMIEGTATYVMHYVYPNFNHEHQWFLFSEDGGLSMLSESYATWPFYFYMAKTHGDQSLRTLHEAWAGYSAFEALDRTLDGGLKKQWLEYAVHEWNQAPLTDSFLQWDNYKAVPGRGIQDVAGHLPPIPVEKIVFDGNGQYRYEMNLLLPPLTRDFYAFDLSGEEVRSIAIENPVFRNADKVNVKALVRRKGQDKFEEILWEDNGRPEYLYCLDKKDEAFDMIVLVIANYLHTRTGGAHTPSPSFKATNQGCYGFKGTVKGRMEMLSPTSKLVLEIIVKDFEVRETGENTDSVYKNKFLTIGGSATYTAIGSMGGCETASAGSLTLRTGKKGLQLDSFQIAPKPWGVYNIQVEVLEPGISMTFTCPPPRKSFVYSFPFTTFTTVISTPYPNHRGKPDLVGEASNFVMFVNWDLKPIKE